MTASGYARRADGTDGGAMAQPSSSARYALATVLLVVGLADLAAIDTVLLPRYLAGRARASSSRLSQPPVAAAPIAATPVAMPPAAATPLVAAPVAIAPVTEAPALLPPATQAAVEAAAPAQPSPTEVEPAQAASAHPAEREFPHLLFARNTSWLSPAAREILARLAATLAEEPSRRVVLSGHTDESGPENLNRALSLERARRCGQWLAGHGVDAARIEIHGFGSTRPVASDPSPEASVHNRRVEIALR